MGEFMVSETWKPIPGFEGHYDASNLGRIKSLARVVIRSNGVSQTWPERILSPGRTTSGHFAVSLRGANKKPKSIRVHQLVMWAHVGPTPPGMEVCHNNGVHTDNRLDNLRFDTHANNMADLRKHGTHPQRSITHCPQGHEYTVENTGREKQNQRYCKACKAAKWREWQNRQGPNYTAEKNAEARERNRDRRAAGVIPESARHGSTGTYSNYGCRCGECIAANREYQAAYKLKRYGPPKPRPVITHCPQGHEYTPENTRIKKGVSRNCRKCENIRWERWRERRQAS